MAVSKKKSRKAALQEANLKLTFVPVVFIVLRVWGTLRFLLGNLAQYDAPWISYLQVSYNISFVFNFCVYINCQTFCQNQKSFVRSPSSFTKNLVTQRKLFLKNPFYQRLIIF